jgi:hypothetical protein
MPVRSSRGIVRVSSIFPWLVLLAVVTTLPLSQISDSRPVHDMLHRVSLTQQQPSQRNQVSSASVVSQICRTECSLLEVVLGDWGARTYGRGKVRCAMHECQMVHVLPLAMPRLQPVRVNVSNLWEGQDIQAGRWSLHQRGRQASPCARGYGVVRAWRER